MIRFGIAAAIALLLEFGLGGVIRSEDVYRWAHGFENADTPLEAWRSYAIAFRAGSWVVMTAAVAGLLFLDAGYWFAGALVAVGIAMNSDAVFGWCYELARSITHNYWLVWQILILISAWAIGTVLLAKMIFDPIVSRVYLWQRRRAFKSNVEELGLRLLKDNLGFIFANLQFRLNPNDDSVTLKWGPQFGPAVSLASENSGGDQMSSSTESGEVTLPCHLVFIDGPHEETYRSYWQRAGTVATVTSGTRFATVTVPGATDSMSVGTGRNKMVIKRYRQAPKIASAHGHFTSGIAEMETIVELWGGAGGVWSRKLEPFFRRLDQHANISLEKARAA